MQTFTSQLRRRQLDQVLGALRTIQPSLTPRGGWIRELRKAIGMTGAQLAKRLHVTAAAITQMEKGEQAGTITLASLRKCADAMDSELVYVLMPRTALTKMVDERIRAYAQDRIASVARTMNLEAQATSDEYSYEQLTHLIAKFQEHPPRDMWDMNDAPGR